MPDDIVDEILTAAQEPAEASGDMGSVRVHPLKDQIAADQYGKSSTAAGKAHRGLRFTQLVPPGAS